jgi:hypothetical protein
MEAIMKLSLRILITVGGLVAAISTPLVQAESGSDSLFNAEVAQVQHRVALRNQLDDDLVQSQLALGYSVPESLDPQSKTMQARADGDAFTTAMRHLQRTMVMYAAAD